MNRKHNDRYNSHLFRSPLQESDDEREIGNESTGHANSHPGIQDFRVWLDLNGPISFRLDIPVISKARNLQENSEWDSDATENRRPEGMWLNYDFLVSRSHIPTIYNWG